MHLFDPSLLASHATVVSPSTSECLARLTLLEHLRMRRDDGSLAALAETRVEQSFNERLFAEAFDYRTLLRDGGADFHLLPKAYDATTRQYDDFSLGFFGPLGGKRQVTAELKGVTINLDSPQSSRKDGASPVTQAHMAVSGVPSVKWVLVSNYDEMRLYRAGEVGRFERVVLTELDTVDDFRRAYALFGRWSLLGVDGSTQSPLEVLWDEKERAMLGSQQGYVRLVHEASVTDVKTSELRESPAPLHCLDDALRRTFKELEVASFEDGLPWPEPFGIYGMKLADGKLRQRLERDGRGVLIEASPAGVLRVWEQIGSTLMGASSLQSDVIAAHMAAFVHFAGRVLSRGCNTNHVRFRWSLRDIAGTRLEDGWLGNGPPVLRCEVDTSSSPWINVDVSKKASNLAVTALLTAFRELVFPFEATELGEVMRLTPQRRAFQATVGASLSHATGPAE